MMLEPWQEEEARQAQQDIEYERWCKDRPICRICGERIGKEEVIDFTDQLEEGIYHADCLWDALKFGRLNMTRGEELYELIYEAHGRFLE